MNNKEKGTYETVFKFPEWNVFLTDLFFVPYQKVSKDPIVLIENGAWQFLLNGESLRKLSETGYKRALKKGCFEELKNGLAESEKQIMEASNERLDKMSNEEFVAFLDRFFDAGRKFSDCYKYTEFLYFTRVEEEVQKFVSKRNEPLENVLSGKVDMGSWPESIREITNYLISVQHLKFEARKVVNEAMLGDTSIISRIFVELIGRTGRQDVPHMTLKEIKAVFKGEKVKDVSDRHTLSYITYDCELKVLTGAEAEQKIKEIERNVPKEVRGAIACKGVARGKVKIIRLSTNPEKEMAKMEEGDILVSDTTGPELMYAVKKAAAIVTDEGGLMSHAAVVSREFKIPCIVGTKAGTQILHDGDLVEVDANNGVVRKIN